MFFNFEKNNILKNVIKAYPLSHFLIYENVFYNYEKQNNINSLTPNGSINIFDENVSRASNLIYPFIVKGSDYLNIRENATSSLTSYLYGDIISSSYPILKNIEIDRYDSNDLVRRKVYSLENTMEYNSLYSNHYHFSCSSWNKGTQELTMLTFPKIFFGSQIKKGSVKLDFYITGTKIAELNDIKQNGELIETYGINSGSTAGIVLYKEGFIVLTGSWDISDGNHVEDYKLLGVGEEVAPAWKYFGVTGSSGDFPVSSSFEISFNGTTYIPTMTMFCSAPKGKLNWSNNPTFVETQNQDILSSSFFYKEDDTILIENTKQSIYEHFSESYSPQTFISEIKIYDKYKNVIAIVKLANPIKKREEDDIMFKLRMDL